jgi:hypothetical protein
MSIVVSAEAFPLVLRPKGVRCETDMGRESIFKVSSLLRRFSSFCCHVQICSREATLENRAWRARIMVSTSDRILDNDHNVSSV